MGEGSRAHPEIPILKNRCAASRRLPHRMDANRVTQSRGGRPERAPEPVAPSLPSLPSPPTAAPERPPPRWARGPLVAFVALAVCSLTVAAVLAWEALSSPTTCEDGAAAVCVAEGTRLLASDPARATQRLQRGCDLGEVSGCEIGRAHV